MALGQNDRPPTDDRPPTLDFICSVTVHRYLSPDGSLFYARVTSGQSGT